MCCTCDAKSNEIRRLHKVCNSKDVIINSCIDLITQLLDESGKTNEQKASFQKEIDYFKENVG
jgi:hypothetical protein